MPGKTVSKEKATNDAHPFGMPWLDSCYQETLLPSGPWHKVAEQISDNLASRIAKQFGHPERKQMIFDLMGPEFVQKYFPDEDNNPLIIEQPAISSEVRTKLQLDAQNWLQNAITKVCADIGAVRPVTAEETGVKISVETEEFLRHSRYLFTKGVNRHLHLQEKEIEKKWEDVQWEKQKLNDKSREARERQRDRQRLQREHERLYGGADTAALRGILKGGGGGRRTPGTRLSTGASTASSGGGGGGGSSNHRLQTANVKGAMFGTSSDPPVFWGMQSNSMGRSLIALLKRDPRRFSEISAKLHGRQLPGALKTYVWMDQLLKQERERQHDVHVESVVRERFGKQVARGASELKIKRATHSPISGLIENAVIETYSKTPAMRPFVDDSLSMKEASKALNVLYVYDRSYEPYLIHWLFPLQQCFQDASGEGEHVYELAMYLDLLNKSLFPKWPDIFASAEKVMSRLKGADLELHDHLKYISQRDAFINPKDFLVQLIHQEKSEAQTLHNMTPSNERFKSMSKDLLADPLIFLRKWMGEGFVGVLDTQAAVFIWDQCFLQRWHHSVLEDPGFVGVLDTQAAVFIWDQCFLQRWHHSVLEDTCLGLLFLLKHKFMAAKNYNDMKDVFLREPSLIYTFDIQRAWNHIQNKGAYPEVPYMNRLRPKTPEALPVTPGRRKSPTPSVSSTAPLEAIGIRRLKLTLVVPAESIEREKWLAHLDLKSLHLECNVFFGSIKMGEEKTIHVPVHGGNVEKDKYGALTYRIEYPEDKLVFTGLDVGKYDLEMEMGGVPFAVIELKYGLEGVKEVVTLGWTRVKLYQHKSEVQDRQMPDGQQWVRMDGDYIYTIYGGPTLEKFANDQSKTPMPAGAESPMTDDTESLYSVQSDPQGGLAGGDGGYTTHRIDTPFLEKYGDLLGTNCQLGVLIYNPYSTAPTSATPAPARRPSPAKASPTPTRTPASSPRREPVVMTQPIRPDSQTPPPPPPPDTMADSPSRTSTPPQTQEPISRTPSVTKSPQLDRTPTPTRKTASRTPSPELKAASRTPTPKEPEQPSERKKTPSTPKKELGLADTFDLYIDAVSNIPDNSTVIKVTGRFVKTGEVKDVTDVLALPELSSPARNPRFKYRHTLNEQQSEFDGSLVALLRVYTVDLDTRELVVIGSCLFELFDENQTLKVGNVCRQIHSGMPDLKQGLEGINHRALDDAPRIPGCRLYIRVAEKTKNYVSPPSLTDYKVEDPPFNSSEKKVMQSFSRDTQFPKTVKHAVKDLRDQDEEEDRSKDSTLWLSDRLDNKKQLPPNQPAENLDIHRLVRYRLQVGFSISIVQAYGLPEGYYMQCFARIAPGKKAIGMATTPEGYGKDEKLITLKHNWESPQTAPEWQDKTSQWHPHLDDNTCIIVQIFRMDPLYKPASDHKSPGKMTRRDGRPLTLGDEDLLGWAVVPLFEKDYVLNGRHHVPIFKKKPDQDLLDSLTEELPEDVIGNKTWDNSSKYDAAALVVDIWDSHFLKDDIPGGLVRTDFLLDVLNNKDPYLKAESEKSGKKMSELVTSHLSKKDQKQNSPVYKKEKEFYQQAITENYTNLMEGAVMNAGYGPL